MHLVKSQIEQIIICAFLRRKVKTAPWKENCYCCYHIRTGSYGGGGATGGEQNVTFGCNSVTRRTSRGGGRLSVRWHQRPPTSQSPVSRPSRVTTNEFFLRVGRLPPPFTQRLEYYFCSQQRVPLIINTIIYYKR